MVAETRLYGKLAGEEPFEIVIRIGLPYKSDSAWACPVSIEPLHNSLPDIRGDDSLQSLCLAISMAIDLLSGFKASGGKLLNSTGELFSLEPYSFGAANRE